MEKLNYQDVVLTLNEFVEDIEGWPPYYIFDIYVGAAEESIGRIVFRCGSDNEHEFAGHIGYSIDEPYRGHYYAYQACLALKQFILSLGYDHVLITCSPDNIASKKTIEKLGAEFVETKAIPNDLRKEFTVSETHKRIYYWQLQKETK
ncbi:GNAT family N-acetyltransferase [Beduini massiliensis]|uniref:GNAT family N-acetyltransferase n=1 Tax=Beduini massiliensis TaxID=1585974 RepID=UPI00059A9AD7|nr:GNAT family N-acetyltransferase [Beduini massiliensis]